MIRNIFTLLVWSKKNLHCERRKKLIYEKFARIKNGEKTIGMPSWKCDYDMNEKTWNSAAAVVVEWGLKRMSFPSNDAHHLLILLIPSHTLVVRRNCGKRAGEKEKITLNKNIESLFGRFTNSVCFWYSLVEWHIPPSRLQATFYYYTYCITFSLLLTVLCLCTDTWIESFGFRRISSNESFHLIPINNRTLFIEAGVMCKCVPFIQNCQNICGNVIRSYILTNDFSSSPRKQILNLNCMA